MLLETRQLSRTFGGVHAVDRVDLAVAAGQAFGLIGPNGAGKTTLINLISGHLRADGGSVLLDGATVTRLAPHELTARGIARAREWRGPPRTTAQLIRQGAGGELGSARPASRGRTR